MNIKISEERPWGTYMVIDERDQYKVKRITVKKGHKLSSKIMIIELINFKISFFYLSLITFLILLLT